MGHERAEGGSVATLAPAATRLATYVPRIAAEWSLDAPGRRWQEVDGTLCFADVSGFTALSERLAARGRVGAEELTEILSRVFGTMLELAYRRGGSLLKFGGDALLLLFRGENHAAQAVSAAVEMRAALREATKERTSVGAITLRMSQGLHSGPIHLFKVGRTHGELIVTGPGASSTTAMEHAADAGEVLVSQAVRDAIGADATPLAKGPGWLLRWRRAATPPGSIEPRRLVDPAEVASCLPVALREHLEHGIATPEHRIATIGFVKFTGVDALLGTRGPDAVASALDDLIVAVQDATAIEGVTILATDIDEDGGKVILAAGVPVARDDDEGRMLRAVRHIADASLDLGVQIGVNRGHVFAGEVGSAYRRTYTVMGDTVNLAARLMAKADTGEIFTVPDVVARSQTPFDSTVLEPFTVKGKSVRIHACALGARRSADDVVVVESSLPLVGRDREIGQLRDAWRSAFVGAGRVVEIVGDAGIGKTRLLEAALREEDDALRLRAECRLYQSSTPYFPVRRLLRQALSAEGLDDDETVARLRAVVGERAPHLLPWLALVGAVLDIAIEPSPEVAAMEERFRRERLEDVVLELLVTLLQTPTVAVIEDVQYMDEASRSLLARRVAEIGDLPWLLCLTSRPVDGAFHVPAQPFVSRLELGPLEVAAAAELVAEASGDDLLLAQDVATVVERADGNPLFLIELVEMRRAGTDIDALPESVEGMIEVRIDRLPPRDRTALRRLAVLGTGFELAHTEAVLPGTTHLDRVATIGRLRDFVALDGSGWVRFRHGLTRDVAYHGLPFRARRELHGRVADAIQAAAADQHELLSVHYFHAARWPEAWRFSMEAAEAARRSYANLDAAVLLERAVAAAARLPVLDRRDVGAAWRALGQVHEVVGRFGDALAALREAARAFRDDPTPRAQVHLQRARVLGRMGSYGPALRETAIGLRLLDGLRGADAAIERPRLLAFRGLLRLQQGRAREALELARESAAAAQAAGEEAVLAEAYSVLDGALEALGRPDEAVYEQRALEIHRRAGHLPGIAMATGNLGVRAYAEGRWNEALEFYAQALDALRRSGNEAQAALAEANIVEVLVSQGRLDEAAPVARHAVRVMRAHNLLDMLAFAETQEARLLLEQGDVDEAVERLARITAEATAIGRSAWALEAAIYLAAAHVRRGRAAGALELLDDAEREAGDAAAMYRAQIAVVRSRVLAALGRYDDAALEVVEGLIAAERRGQLYERARLMITGCEVAALAGGVPDASTLQEAEGILQRLGVTAA